MIHRLINPSKNTSFFIFGARGTGKSTFVEDQLLPTWGVRLPAEYRTQSEWYFDGVLYLDLLNDDLEESISADPELLKRKVESMNSKPKWIVIDEIQKVPRLLDVVHSMIEKQKIKFILTGSSARKLKKEGANLLGGRAFEYSLMPFTSIELQNGFQLTEALNFGLLPTLLNFTEQEDKIKYLRSYVRTYVKVEIQMEQLVRKLEPFREFLEVAAQMNGKILNFTKIAKEVGVDTKTVQLYYLILEETYLGFRLPCFHHSLRKSQLLTPKFYFFDIGVKRALDQSLHSPVIPGTSFYGETFEHFVILEFYKLNLYLETDYRLSYFSTKEGSEVDLILSRGREIIFIEIKSSTQVDLVEVNKLNAIAKGHTKKAYYLSCDPHSQKIENVTCLPWQKGLHEIFKL